MAVGQDGVLAEFQPLSHRGSRFLFRLLVGVDVDVQRGRNIGVTEKFLNLFNVHSLRQKQASCRMTQIVKADFRQAVFRQQLLKVVRNIARQDDTAIRPNKSES